MHEGTEKGVAAAKKAALDSLPDDGVTILNQMTLDRWMQESLGTTSASAFCMLFSDKPPSRPLQGARGVRWQARLRWRKRPIRTSPDASMCEGTDPAGHVPGYVQG